MPRALNDRARRLCPTVVPSVLCPVLRPRRWRSPTLARGAPRRATCHRRSTSQRCARGSHAQTHHTACCMLF
eukprot:6101982-Pleurochrysis_carterae.AAC.4